VRDELPDRYSRPVRLQRTDVHFDRFVKANPAGLDQMQHGDGDDGLAH
jgi:hypothetical protein